MTPLEGGCLCGNIRYWADAEPTSETFCHCSICRRASGAPVVAWATFPAQNFAFTRGQPGRFESSEIAFREFCPNCGTQLTFRYLASLDFVDVTIASLDDADAIRPRDHVWFGSRIRWFDSADRLPRHQSRRARD